MNSLPTFLMAGKRSLYKRVEPSGSLLYDWRDLSPGLALDDTERSGTLTNLSFSHGKTANTLLTEDLHGTPRKSIPHAEAFHTEAAVLLAPSLDLSDVVDDGNEMDSLPAASDFSQPDAERVSHDDDEGGGHVAQCHTPAMVLNTSVVGCSEDGTSVKYAHGYERSPATVIRHFPRKHVHNPDKYAAEVAEGNSLPADYGKSSGMLSLPSSNVSMSKTRSTNFKRAGHSRPHRPQLHASDISRPRFQESSSVAVRQQAVGGVDTMVVVSPRDVTSSSDSCLVPDTASCHPNKTKALQDKIKKGGKIIPSRYMQMPPAKKPVDKSDKLTSIVRAKKYDARRFSGSKMTSQVCNSDLIKAGKTSTPTRDDVSCLAMYNTSLINPELSLLSVFDVSHVNDGHSGVRSASRKQPQKVNAQKIQQLLSMAYTRYLQFLYLDCRSSTAFHLQEKDAMKQLHSMWQAVEEKRKERSDLTMQVDRLKHLRMLDRHLESQMSGLEKVERNLAAFRQHYTDLAEALDVTRHRIPTRGIHMPPDIDSYMADLSRTVEESERILDAIQLTAVMEDSQSICDFATSLKSVESNLDTQCSDLHKCNELLSAMQSLATHEMSLHIQGIHQSSL